MVWLVFTGWVILSANEWEDSSNYFGGGMEISRNWAKPTFWPFMASLITVMALVFVSFGMLICYNEHTVRFKNHIMILLEVESFPILDLVGSNHVLLPYH